MLEKFIEAKTEDFQRSELLDPSMKLCVLADDLLQGLQACQSDFGYFGANFLDIDASKVAQGGTLPVNIRMHLKNILEEVSALDTLQSLEKRNPKLLYIRL